MIIVKLPQYENGAFANSLEAKECPDGWLILPDDLKPEHFPFFDILETEGNFITAVRDGVIPEVGAEDKRREAYESDPCIEFNGQNITVDQARAICLEYFFESNERAKDIVDELTQKITAAKDAIRTQFAD